MLAIQEGKRMKKIEIRMQEVLNRGEKVLVSGVPIGYPDLDTTRRVVERYIKSGIDVVEFSMPSPDPYIDTKTIADSNILALRTESNLDKYFETLFKVREDFPDEPFYMMAYADLILKYGVERFVKTIHELGIDSVELPDKEDAFPDLVRQLDPSLEKAGIYRTYILKHPFNENYFNTIRNKAKGFLLLQSVADAKGKRASVAPENKNIIDKMRNTGLDAVIILGYGINNPERVKEAVAAGADGVIVGTAMVERISEGDFAALSKFIREMKAATLP
jgi:tryptophan synthase alpha chain